MTKRYHDPEKKAAVMAALLSGQSIDSIVTDYNVPRGTVAGWKRELNAAELYDTEKKADIGELLLIYLRANLETLAAQVKLFADPQWLREQSASEAAVLHGVMTDKAIRLMEAFGRANGSDSTSTD